MKSSTGDGGLVYAVKSVVKFIIAENEHERPPSRTENEKWQAEGHVVNPEVPEPSTECYTNWRTFVSSVYNHPNLLVHPDVKCIREVFKMLGATILFETQNLMVELGARSNDASPASIHYLQPPLYFVEESASLVFGHIEEIQLVPHLNVAIVRKYSVMENYKSALLKFANLITNYPEVILYPDYTFLYDFLIRFGVTSEAITYEIYKTQLRRSKFQVPASTLLLKQESLDIQNTIDSDENICSSDDDNGHIQTLSNAESEVDSVPSTRSRGFRQGSNLSGGDSGFGSIDQHENSSSASDVDINVKIKQESDEYEESMRMSPRKGRQLKGTGDKSRMFKCTVCCKQYSTRLDCNKHIIVAHKHGQLILTPRQGRIGKSVKKFDCPICCNAFLAKTQYQTHMKIHHHIDQLKNLPRNRKSASSLVAKKSKCNKAKRSMSIKTESESIPKIVKFKKNCKKKPIKRETDKDKLMGQESPSHRLTGKSKNLHKSKCRKRLNDVLDNQPRKFKRKCKKISKTMCIENFHASKSLYLNTRSRTRFEKQRLQSSEFNFQAQETNRMSLSQVSISALFITDFEAEENIISQNTFLK